LTTEKLCFDSREGVIYCSSPKCQEKLWGPPSLLFNGYHGQFPREHCARVMTANHSRPHNTENGWCYFSIRPTRLNSVLPLPSQCKLRPRKTSEFLDHPSRLPKVCVHYNRHGSIFSEVFPTLFCNEMNNFRGLSSPIPCTSLGKATEWLCLTQLLLTRPTGLVPHVNKFQLQPT